MFPHTASRDKTKVRTSRKMLNILKRKVHPTCACACLHIQHTVLVTIHVDDILSIASTKEENEHFKTQLQSKWTILDLGDVNFALGIGISHDCTVHSVALNQTTFIDHVITQFKQQDAHPALNPMDKSITL